MSHPDTGPEPPRYAPPRMLRNGQLQTLVANLPPMPWLANRRGAALISRAQELLLDCGDGVRLQGFLSTAGGIGNSGGAAEESAESTGRRVAIVLHGWEGSARSCYVVSLGAELLASGYDVLRLNLRDHGTSHELNRGIFHSCRLAEVVGAVRSVAARFGGARIFLAGFSLGGNFMLRVSADAEAPSTIAGAVAVSPVLEPAATLVALERGWWIYRRYFVRRWSRSLRRKRLAWPDLPDIEPILRSRDLRAMTAGLVGQFTDFRSLEAYLDGYSVTGRRLASLRFPATVLLAEDDPMIPAGDLARLAPSPLLTVVGTRHGGHCGFVERLNGPSFADRLVLSQFERFEREASAAPGLPRTRAGTARPKDMLGYLRRAPKAAPNAGDTPGP